jgi:hypothetical protein
MECCAARGDRAVRRLDLTECRAETTRVSCGSQRQTRCDATLQTTTTLAMCRCTRVDTHSPLWLQTCHSELWFSTTKTVRCDSAETSDSRGQSSTLALCPADEHDHDAGAVPLHDGQHPLPHAAADMPWRARRNFEGHCHALISPTARVASLATCNTGRK